MNLFTFTNVHLFRDMGIYHSPRNNWGNLDTYLFVLRCGKLFLDTSQNTDSECCQSEPRWWQVTP